jgi:PIN domain nuclease of toxin-antitoxin system
MLAFPVREMIADPANMVHVSAASVWEIATKRRRRKLAFDGSPVAAITEAGFRPLPILPEDAEDAGNLSWSHTDPFDRLLVAQSLSRGLVLVTADAAIRAFGAVPHLMAR